MPVGPDHWARRYVKSLPVGNPDPHLANAAAILLGEVEALEADLADARRRLEEMGGAERFKRRGRG